MSDSRQERATEREQARVSAEVLAGISNGMVRLFREYFGRGPTAAKTYALDDVVVCVLRDGLTPAERTLFERGRADAVREIRAAFQDAAADEFKGVVERLTDRRVVAFMSQAHVNPDLAVEIFFLDAALPHGHAEALETDGNGEPIE
jgi:uncharacterized protein YbcI